ncbi:MAG: aminotransferase class IV [Flavobacteriaceae bacterium]|nr:aminotransferase class IV [Flavobacteriaceae bacterium]MCY4266529.1 aminotransferase class IV [Flavobacteriaceae bacterium]MCY4299829.1 aminotransferase class IV [Flavobacteriaceae bacterium]
MWNHNGQLTSEHTPLEGSLVRGLLNGLVYTESVRIKERNIFFWDHHYFNLMAFLRLNRVEIPEKYSLHYLKTEVLKTRDLRCDSKNVLVDIYLLVQPDAKKNPKKIEFFMESKRTDSLKNQISTTSHQTDVFDEIRIISNRLSNQTSINQLVFNVARSYAKENKLDSVLLINESRDLVESIDGSLFLYNQKNNKICTPSLESGCQNLAIRLDFIDFIEKSTEIKFVCESVTSHQLKQSDELMVLSIQKGVTCVTSYRGSYYKTSVTENLFNQYCIDRGLI